MAAHRPASGREQHTHKITVYLSADELFDLEHARLTLRRYGITTDRGRLVREAIVVVLADLDARGETSVLARRIADPYPGGANPSAGRGTGPGTGPGPYPGGPGPGPYLDGPGAGPYPDSAGADPGPGPRADGLISREPESHTRPREPETQH